MNTIVQNEQEVKNQIDTDINNIQKKTQSADNAILQLSAFAFALTNLAPNIIPEYLLFNDELKKLYCPCREDLKVARCLGREWFNIYVDLRSLIIEEIISSADDIKQFNLLSNTLNEQGLLNANIPTLITLVQDLKQSMIKKRAKFEIYYKQDIKTQTKTGILADYSKRVSDLSDKMIEDNKELESYEQIQLKSTDKTEKEIKKIKSQINVLTQEGEELKSSIHKLRVASMAVSFIPILGIPAVIGTTVAGSSKSSRLYEIQETIQKLNSEISALEDEMKLKVHIQHFVPELNSQFKVVTQKVHDMTLVVTDVIQVWTTIEKKIGLIIEKLQTADDKNANSILFYANSSAAYSKWEDLRLFASNLGLRSLQFELLELS